MTLIGKIKVTDRTYKFNGALREKTGLKQRCEINNITPSTELGFDEENKKVFRIFGENQLNKCWSEWEIDHGAGIFRKGKSLPEIDIETLKEKINSALKSGLKTKPKQTQKCKRKSSVKRCKKTAEESKGVNFDVLLNDLSDLIKRPSYYAESDFNTDAYLKRKNLKETGASQRQMKFFEIGVALAKATQKWPASRRFNGGGG